MALRNLEVLTKFQFYKVRLKPEASAIIEAAKSISILQSSIKTRFPVPALRHVVNFNSTKFD